MTHVVDERVARGDAAEAGPADLRIALWQCDAQPLDVAGNLARLDRQAAQARAGGADLLICPEMFLTGYAIGAEAVQRLAEPADGPGARAVAHLARHHGLALAYGYPERAPDGRVHNAAQLIGADGTVLARCRKAHLYGAMDRAMFAPGDGNEPPGLLHGWRIGLAICYDIEFPETARRLALAGADLIAVPTANMVEFDLVPELLLPARAIEAQAFVAYANYRGDEGELRYGGLSCVVAPDGAAPVRAGRDETLMFADLSRDRLRASRQVFTHVQDTRPSAFGKISGNADC